MNAERIRETVVRWLKFNAVGGIGIFVQLAALAAFKSLLGMNYLLATGLAVEVAMLHNYIWHHHWTWSDRASGAHLGTILWRLAQFNLTTGAVSIVANLVLMRLFVGQFGLHYLPANLLAIAICAVANFVVSDRVVFRAARPD